MPFLNPQDETYWLLDPTFVWAGGGSGGESGNGGDNNGNGGDSGNGGNEGNGGDSGNGGEGGSTRTYSRVTINGSVPIENYNELFSSFIQTLRYNHLKIEMKFSAETTSTNPLTENSPIVKSIKESASQLGLNISFEE